MSSLTFCNFILLVLILTKRFLLALLLALFGEIFEFSCWRQLVAILVRRKCLMRSELKLAAEIIGAACRKILSPR
jgi:hypothetical protein